MAEFNFIPLDDEEPATAPASLFSAVSSISPDEPEEPVSASPSRRPVSFIPLDEPAAPAPPSRRPVSFIPLDEPDAPASALADPLDTAVKDSALIDADLPTVTVFGRRPGPEPSWSELLVDELPTQIGAQTAKRIGGGLEYVGDTRYGAARKELWQSIVLPWAVRDAQAQGIALTEHPDVVEQAKRLGIRPEVFARDWPKYANLNDDELLQIQRDAVARIRSSSAQRERGTEMRQRAQQVAELYRPELEEWSAQSLVFDAASSLPDLLIGVGAGALGGSVAGLGAMAALTAPGYYADAKNMGLDPQKADTYAALMTLSEVVPELPLFEFLSRNQAGREAVRRSLGKLVGDSARSIGGAALTEGLSESITELMQIGIDQGLLDQNATLPDALKRIARAGTVGGVMGAGVGTVHEGGAIAGEVLARRGEAAPPGPDVAPMEPGTAAGAPEGAAPRREPYISETVPEVRQGEPGIWGVPRGTGEAQPAPEGTQPPTQGGVTQTAPMRPEGLRADLEALAAGNATPEQVARLEAKKFAIRSETNVPRLLPAGRRALAELRKQEEREDPFRAPEPVKEAPRLQTDEALRAGLLAMKDETGWAEEGGRLLMDEEGRVLGRTSWIPRAEWWPGRPGGLSEEQVHKAIDKALAGERLGSREQAMVDFMVEVYDQRQKLGRYVPEREDFPEDYGEPDIDDQYEAAMVARATEIDEGAVERLAIQYDDDRAGFLAAIKDLLDEHDNAATAFDRQEGARPAEQEAEEESAEEVAPEADVGTGEQVPTPAEQRAGEDAIFRVDVFQRDLEKAREVTDRNPTFAQAKAGTYRKGRLKFAGLPIALENPKGSTRKGYDEDGNVTWQRVMEADYGYIERTEGSDGDQVDVFLAGAPDTGRVFVVNQIDPKTGRFDEHKVILGAHTRQEADRLYHAHYPKGWKGMGSMIELSTEEFKAWLKSGRTKEPLERRRDHTRRQRVAQMTREEMRQALLTHELTGIANRRAYEEIEKLPVQIAIDVDSLKWVNDNMGHESGNELLKAVATALKDETHQAFHISGDEFVAQARKLEEARALMERVAKRLAGAKIEVELEDGAVLTVEGLGISYGFGGTLDEADKQLQAHKAEREAKGLRAGRGAAPPGTRLRDSEREDQARGVAEEVRFARRKQESAQENADEWFRGSKVVDARGRPLTVYHGSAREFDEFRGGSSPGIFFTSRRESAAGFGPHVTAAHLAIRKPLIVNARGDLWDDIDRYAVPDEKVRAHLSEERSDQSGFTTEQIVQAVRDAKAGYDGVIFEGVIDHATARKRSTVYAVLEPTQIRRVEPSVRFARRKQDERRKPDGFTVEIRRNEAETGTFAEAFAPDGQLAGYLFVPDKREGRGGGVSGDRWSAGDVLVQPKYRRQGVATLLYDAMEAHLGKPAEPGPVQTPEARAFWEARGVRFARREHPTETPGFKRWFGQSKVVDAEGKPQRVYHGTTRLDRFSAGLRRSRATSGPMPFFTDDPAIASSYATNKADTSLSAEEQHYENWFTYRPKGSRQPVSITRMWWELTPEQRAKFNEMLTRLRQNDETLEIEDGGPDGGLSPSSYEYELAQARGNGIKAAIDLWLTSGSLYREEQRFLDVLRMAGLPMRGIEYVDQGAGRPGVVPVYLRIENPLDTSLLSEKVDDNTWRPTELGKQVLEVLREAGKRRRGSRIHSGDLWDKRKWSGPEWISAFEDDLRKGTTNVWTSIPDWVTDALQRMGYDGVRDRGGKYSDQSHTVWVPFTPEQVKSATGNRGTYRESGNFLFARRTTPIEQWELNAFAHDVKKDLGLEEFDLRSLPNGDISLELIVVPKEGRKNGKGSEAMKRLIDFADARQARVVLSLADSGWHYGTSSKERLRRFYGRFGFVSNRGHQHKPELYTDMYREPRESYFARMFYSPAIRVVEGLTQGKASAEQWWKTITARPGIKPEELQWMGLKEWLDEHGTKPITREELLQFMQANQIQVDEVLLGAPELISENERERVRLQEEIRAEGGHVRYSPLNGELVEVRLRGSRYYYPPDSAGASFHDIEDDAMRARVLRLAELAEKRRGEPPSPRTAIYPQYQLAGGEHYRELLLTWVMPGLPSQRAEKLTALPEGYEARQSRGKWAVFTTADNERFGAWFGSRDEAVKDALDALNAMRQAVAAAKYNEAIEERGFRSGHYPAVPNILAHVRFNERVDADGKRVFFIEEVQSDWHQTGRDKGYRVPGRAEQLAAELEQARVAALEAVRRENNLGFSTANAALTFVQYTTREGIEGLKATPETAAILENFARLAELEHNERRTVPDAPFKTTWPELVVKRVVRWAVEYGFDRIAWTPGAVQVERYELAKHIKRIELHDNISTGAARVRMEGPFKDGLVIAYDHSNREAIRKYVYSRDDLAEVIGQDLAERLLAVEPTERLVAGTGVRERALSGLDVQIGGEGMYAFYDEILPRTIGKLIKRWGGKVGTTTIDIARGGGGILSRAHAFDVTPQMREAAMEGLPLFRRGPRGRGLLAADVQRYIDEKIRQTSLGSRLPPVRVVQRVTDTRIPAFVREQIRRDRAEETTTAVFVPGIMGGDAIYAIADNLTDELELLEYVMHEGVGHYGLRLALSVEEYEEIMDGLWRDSPERVREAARRNSLDVNDIDQRRTAAEEVIAYAAGQILSGQTVEAPVLSWYRRLIDAIKRFLDWIGWRNFYGEERIARIVERAKKALEGTNGVHRHMQVARGQRPPLYYSGLWAAVNDPKVPNVAPPAEYAKIIESKKGKEVKPDELEWSGVVPYLQSLTYGNLLWEREGDIGGVKIAEEIRPAAERFRDLMAWRRVYAPGDGQTSGMAMTRALHEADKLGFKPRADADGVAGQFLSVRDQINEALNELRDGALAVPPKRISKDIVLGFIAKEQITIEIVPSEVEDADTDWIDTDYAGDGEQELNEDELDAKVRKAVSDADVQQRARELIAYSPDQYLSDEQDVAAVESGQPVTDAMIEKAAASNGVLAYARAQLEEEWKEKERKEYARNPELYWELEDDSGRYRVEINGRHGRAGEEGYFSGTFRGPGGLVRHVEGTTVRDVEDRLRLVAIKEMPKVITTQYSEYALPGGEDYGERLFVWTNPGRLRGYVGPHWVREDVLLHVRYDTRYGPKGERILFLDEVQSDWHQTVRDRNSDESVETLREKIRNYQDQYRSLWIDGEPDGLPEPRVQVQKWLEELPLTNERFRQLLIDLKASNSVRYAEISYAYQWLAETTGRNVRELRETPVEAAGELEPDVLMSLPLETFDWKKFVAFLRERDERHRREVMDVERNDLDSMLALSQFLADEAHVGGAESDRPDGGPPPSVRVAAVLFNRLYRSFPTYWDVSKLDNPYLADDWRMRNDLLIDRWLDGQLTSDMARSEEARRLLEGIESLREPLRGLLGYSGARRITPTEFERITGKEYADVKLTVQDAIEKFAPNANIAVIDFDLAEAAFKANDTLHEYARRFLVEANKSAPMEPPPLAKTWPLAALKWAIRRAAEEGFSQIALAPGAVHGIRWGATVAADDVVAIPLDRENLKKVIDKPQKGLPLVLDEWLRANPDAEDALHLTFITGDDSIDVYTTASRLPGWMGKDAAAKLLEQKPHSITGERAVDAKRDGVAIWSPNPKQEVRHRLDKVRDIHRGSLEIYNTIMPYMFNKFLAKYGAKIEAGAMTMDEDANPANIGLVELTVERPNTTRWSVKREQKDGYTEVTVLDERGQPVVSMSRADYPDEELIRHVANLEHVRANKRRMVSVPVIRMNAKLRDAALNKGFPLFARRWVHGAKQLAQAIETGTNTFDLPEGSVGSRFWNYLVYKAQDKFIDLFRTQRAVAAWRNVVGLPDAQDAYLKQTLYHGRVEQRIAEYEKTYVEPLVEMIKKSGYDWSEVEEYLYARHAPEANARIRKINPDAPQYSSGMTDDEAAEIMAHYRLTDNFPQLMAIGEHVDAMTKFARDTMVLDGLEDPEVVKTWEETYKHYVPLKGWADLNIETEMPKRGRGFDVGGRLTRMRTGRTSRAGNILANIVAQAQSTIILAEKAKVGRALYDFVSSTPAPNLWAVDEVEYMRYVDPNTGLVRTGINPSFKLADNVIRVRRNGKDYHITFNPQNEMMVRLAAAMKNLNVDQIGPIMGMLHGVNRFLATLNTSLNPEFVITNALRDLSTAMVNITPDARAGIRRKILRDWRKAWWGIRQGEGAPFAGESGKWASDWLEFKRAGGKVGWIDHYKSPQDLERKLRRHLAPDNVLTLTVKGLTAVKDFIENENLAVENAIRLATYVNLRDAGLTRERAAEVAKNLTVNFNRKGEAGTFINSLYLFYNASVQGTAQLVRTLARSPQARVVVGSIVVAGIAMDLLMRAIGGDDEDKEKLYDKVPEHEKERNIIIMIPPHLRGELKSGEKPYIKIMMPYGLNWLYYSGTVLGKYFDYGLLGNVRRVNPGSDAAHIASAFLGAYSPIGDAGGGLSQFLLPTLADPFVQLADNRAWWGGRIMPEDFQDDAPTPDSQKFFQSVPKAYKDFAAWLNARTGGTEVSPGFIDVSPETFEHWIDFATGGAGRFATSVINAPYKAITSPEDLTVQEIPFWRKVVGGIGDRQTQEVFYAHMAELSYVKREIDAVYKMGITTDQGQERLAYIARRYPVAIKMVRAAYPNFAEGRGLEALEKDRILREARRRAIQPDRPISNEPRPRRGQRTAITTVLSDARKEIRRLEARPDMPAAERKARIEAQKKLIHETMIEFNRQWNEVEDSTYGERNQGALIEKLGPFISGRTRREQVRSLRDAGYPETAALLASLPPMPDRFAKEFFNTEAAREETP